MRIFLNKNAKITSASEPRLPPTAEGSAPRPPRYHSFILLQVCRVHF